MSKREPVQISVKVEGENPIVAVMEIRKGDKVETKTGEFTSMKDMHKWLFENFGEQLDDYM